MNWKAVRKDLLQALKALNVADVYLIEHVNATVTVSIVVSGMERIKQLTKIRLIDRLLEMNNPELYRQYVFCYEVWDKHRFDQMPVAKVWHRNM